MRHISVMPTVEDKCGSSWQRSPNFFLFVPCCEPEQMRPRLLHLLSPTEQAGALRQGETVVNCKGARGKKGNG